MSDSGRGPSSSDFFGEIGKLVQIGVAIPTEDYHGPNVRLYDIVERYTADVPFYVEAARCAGGPVLELGCGTGRVLIPMARAGAEVTGLDLSADMLDSCRAKLKAEPAAVAARVNLVQGDMRRYHLGAGRFALVVCPLFTFIHLRTRQDKLAMLARAAEHLRPGGTLLLEAELAGGFKETSAPVLNAVRHDRKTGELLLVLHHARREDGGSVLVNLLNVAVDGFGKATLTAVASRESRTDAEEIADLIARAGLVLEGLWGDYQGGTPAADARGIVLRARRPEQGQT